jgi:hypothetical protein
MSDTRERRPTRVEDAVLEVAALELRGRLEHLLETIPGDDPSHMDASRASYLAAWRRGELRLKQPDRALAQLEADGGWLTLEGIHDLVGGRSDTLRRILYRLWHRGLVEHRPGLWKIR